MKQSGNEYIIVPLTDNIATMKAIYTTNEVGAFIWEQIDGIKTTEQIAEKVQEEYEVHFDKALSDAEIFIQKMISLLTEK